MSKTKLEKLSQYAKSIYLTHKETPEILGRGEYKVCYGYKSFVALIGDRPKTSEDGILNWIQTQNAKAQNILNLLNHGITTPRHLGYVITKNNKDFVELQEKAEGEILCFTNLKSAVEQIFKIPYQNLEKLSIDDNVRLETEIGKRNIKMQKLLKNAPKEQWVKFIKDFKTILDLQIDIDIHGSNFFYDINKGFTFIDLGERKIDRPIPVSYKNELAMIKKLLNDFLRFTTYMPKRYQTIIQKNNEELLKIVKDCFKEICNEKEPSSQIHNP